MILEVASVSLKAVIKILPCGPRPLWPLGDGAQPAWRGSVTPDARMCAILPGPRNRNGARRVARRSLPICGVNARHSSGELRERSGGPACGIDAVELSRGHGAGCSMMSRPAAERIVGGDAIGHLKSVYADFADSGVHFVRSLSSMIRRI